MKKIKYIIFSLILLIPLGVFAAEKPKVNTLTATAENKTISYNGTMEAGSTAVMCKLYDSTNKEIDRLSSEVNATKFNGEFTVTEAGDYKIACANYEGGTIKETTVTVETPLTEIKEITLTFKQPEIGAEIEKDSDEMPTIFPNITVDNNKVTVGGFFIAKAATDEEPEQDLYFGKLVEGETYNLIIDLYLGPEGADYVFADDMKINVEGLEDYTVSTGGSNTYKNVFASFKLTKEEEKQEENEETKEETESPNTGDKIINYLVILSVGVIGAVLGIVYFKKNKLSKKAN